MKVILINGSPKSAGCTYTALNIVAESLKAEGVDAEIVHVGTEPIRGCMGCGTCAKTGEGKCVYNDDAVNSIIEKIADADGLVVGTPVHYAAASGVISSLMDRVCYAGGRNLAFKPATAVVSCRRGGASAAFENINKYFLVCNMPVVPSQYWNQVHGSMPEDVFKDEEGLQTMRTLANNMAWMLKCIEAGKNAGIMPPEKEARIRTNFIR